MIFDRILLMDQVSRFFVLQIQGFWCIYIYIYIYSMMSFHSNKKHVDTCGDDVSKHV